MPHGGTDGGITAKYGFTAISQAEIRSPSSMRGGRGATKETSFMRDGRLAVADGDFDAARLQSFAATVKVARARFQTSAQMAAHEQSEGGGGGDGGGSGDSGGGESAARTRWKKWMKPDSFLTLSEKSARAARHLVEVLQEKAEASTGGEIGRDGFHEALVELGVINSRE